MFFSLDWFAFTFPIPMVGEGDNEYLLSQVLMAFHDHTAHRFLGVVTNGLWQWKAPVGFYANKIMCPKTGLVLEWSSGNGYALCTLSGSACGECTKSISTRDLALAANGRSTRIDLAVDIETDIRPQEFVANRERGRFKSEGHITSESGETCYVGSRTGERLARVYRYADPHPRQHLLRVEVECKGEFAKAVAHRMKIIPLNLLAISVNDAFGWEHPVWKPGELMPSPIKGRRIKTEKMGHIKWLLEVAIPAAAKAHHLEELDAYKALDDAIKKLLSSL